MPHPDKAQEYRFYAAFKEWFENSGVDFWSECGAPEALATIAASMVPNETQESINTWQRENFPNATEEGILKHLFEEFKEFSGASDDIERVVEAADIVIVIYCWAMKKGIDLHKYIDHKMRVNRGRKWNIQPDGTGRHQK